MRHLTPSFYNRSLSILRPHDAVGFDDLKPNGTQPQPTRLFIVQRFISLCGIEWGNLRVCRLRLAGSSTPFSLAPMFDDIERGFKNLHKRPSSMKNTTVQLEQKINRIEEYFIASFLALVILLFVRQ